MPIRKKLGQLLVDSGMLDEYQLRSALGFQKKWGGRLGQVLVDNHFITEEALAQVLKQQTGLALVEMDQRNIPEYLLKLVPVEVAEANNLIPVVLEGGPGQETLVVAMSDPTNSAVLEELGARTGKRVRPVIGMEGAIARAIVRSYRGRARQAQPMPASTELPPPVLDDVPEMVLVQGRLEAPPQGAPLSAALDPFAELDALAQSRRPFPAGLTPAPAPSTPAPDSAAGSGPSSLVHPASTPLDLDGTVDVLFDDSVMGTGSHPPRTGAPPPPNAGDAGEVVEELELVEDIEELGGPGPDQITPVPGPAPAPPAEGVALPGYFGGEGASLPPDLADAFAADAMEAVGELDAPSPSAPEPPDLGRPADLSDVPDLDLPAAPPAALALESAGEPVDLSLDGDAEEAASLGTQDREPTVVSRVSAQMARGLEAQRSAADAVPRPAPAQAAPAAAAPSPARPAAKPAPALPSVVAQPGRQGLPAAPAARPAPVSAPSSSARPATARSTVAEVEPPSARPKTGSGKAAPGSPSMQALLAKLGIRKAGEEAVGPGGATPPAGVPAALPVVPPVALPAAVPALPPAAPPERAPASSGSPLPPQASLDSDQVAPQPREAPTMIHTLRPAPPEEGTQPRALTVADPVLRALIKVLADKGLVTEREIIEELLRG
ncbi:MAG TPA: hypothetical protein PK668_16365 [Myxococcota bacterium]|nr:hypothetical protein [Myxococcota bacterium]HRY94467.1 hypothetical protein [Myxococcota bacterium]HSA24150.1 hypothetical protein [Myxococcota bacterium]